MDRHWVSVADCQCSEVSKLFLLSPDTPTLRLSSSLCFVLERTGKYLNSDEGAVALLKSE